MTLSAAEIQVTSFEDAPNGTDCTLREAVLAANTDKAVGGCAAGNAHDTIILTPGTYLLSIEVGLDDPEYGDLDILEDLTIRGRGARIEPADPTSFSDRLFEVRNNVRMEQVVLRYGRSPDRGGAVLVGKYGSLELVSSVLLDNIALESGGGIQVEDGGELFLEQTRLLRNETDGDGGGLAVTQGRVEVRSQSILAGGQAGVSGGGLFVGPGGRVQGTSLRILNNRAIDGGGFAIADGTVDLERSSIASNQAEIWAGAGLVYGGSLILRSSSVAANRLIGPFTIPNSLAVQGPGTAELVDTRIEHNHGNVQVLGDGRLVLRGSTVNDNVLVGDPPNPSLAPAAVAGLDASYLEVVNSTVSDNRFPLVGPRYGVVGADWIVNSTILNLASGGRWRNSIFVAGCAGGFDSDGFNLIGKSGLPCKLGPSPTDILGVAPKLGPLAFNGGPTPTHALLEGSPAIDASPGCSDPQGVVLAVDQTLHQRPVGPKCDIGAFEFDASRTPPGGGSIEISRQ